MPAHRRFYPLSYQAFLAGPQVVLRLGRIAPTHVLLSVSLFHVMYNWGTARLVPAC